jgi:hypothetical protein
MKTLFNTKTFMAVAVAVATTLGALGQAQAQPTPSASDSALPANIVPGSPLAEVVKMVQAGVDVGTIQSYVVNSASPFNLDADKIIFLKDMGVPSELVNAMMDRDKILYASTVTPPVTPVTPEAPTVADATPPPAEVTVNYFYDTLTPYGSWVDIGGYGRCWRPTAVIYDAGWRPYCDRGHWDYTDCGWYWDSDYSWGVTFHYGRWFHHSRFGWVWYPDTVWAPSWVTWRSGGEYCGWAPLPPFAVFTPGVGFMYRGARVAMDFDFGLGADCFMFLSPAHFCDRHPRSFCVEPTRVTQIFHQTTIVNNYNVNNRFIVNRGISVDHISSATHHTIEPIQVGSLPNAGRQGWRGEGYERSFQHSGTENNAGRNLSSGNGQLRHGPEFHNDLNNTANANRHETLGQATQGAKPSGNQLESLHSTSQPNLKGEANNNNQTAYQLQHHSDSTATGSHFQQSQQNTATTGTAVSNHRLSQNNLPAGGAGNGQSQITAHDQQTFQSRQIRSSDATTSDGSQPHGSSQLEQHQSGTTVQPHVDQHVETVTRNANPPPPPPPPSQNQSHNSNSGANGGSNNSSDKNKQNH